MSAGNIDLYTPTCYFCRVGSSFITVTLFQTDSSRTRSPNTLQSWSLVRQILKNRVTRVRSTLRGNSLLLGLFLVTCGCLVCFWLRVEPSRPLFSSFHDVVGNRAWVDVGNFQAGPAIDPRPLSKRRSSKIWPKRKFRKTNPKFRGRKEQLMTLEKWN